MAFKYKVFSVRKSATAGMRTKCLALACDAACPDYEIAFISKRTF